MGDIEEQEKLKNLIARATKKVMKMPGWKDDFKLKAAKDETNSPKFYDEDDFIATDDEVVTRDERDRIEDA
jgi:hypothetical protein